MRAVQCAGVRAVVAGRPRRVPHGARRLVHSLLQLPPLVRDVVRLPPGEAVPRLPGWVQSVRRAKTKLFVALGDGSCHQPLQVVVDRAALPDLAPLSPGTAVRISGTVVASPGRGQRVELAAQDIEVVGECDNQLYPLQKQSLPPEVLRDHLHLRPRTRTAAAVTRVRSELLHCIHGFFRAHAFQHVHTPILTSSDCEGAGEAFRVTTDQQGGDGAIDQHFFGHPVFLTVSGQLHAEAAATALSRVYTAGPTFRAENSHTTRHLAEFYMVEAEAACTDLAATADVIEACVQTCCDSLLDDCRDDLAFLHELHCGVASGDLENDKHRLATSLRSTADRGFARISFGDAVKEMRASHHSFAVEPSMAADLTSEHEQWLVQHCEGPVFVLNYPRAFKPFYMRQNEDGTTVAALDLLMPRVGELAGGSEREERLDRLEAAMVRHGLGSEYDWYRELRRFGSMPHAGFGIGFERLLQFVTGVPNIRDAITFPRTAGRALL